MIQGKFYQRLHFYTDSCAISPTASLLSRRSYLDSFAEEVNDKLQEQGNITLVELTKTYDLPSEFLINVSDNFIFCAK